MRHLGIIVYWHVAQLVEQSAVNRCVVGSIPTLPVKLTVITLTKDCRKRYKVRIKLYNVVTKAILGMAVTLRLLYLPTWCNGITAAC